MSRYKPLPETMLVQSRLEMKESDLNRHEIGTGADGAVFKLPISGKKDLRKMFPELSKGEAKSIVETLRSRGFEQSNMHVIVKQMSYRTRENFDEMKMHQALSRMSRGQEFIPTLVGGGDSSDNDDAKQWIISMPVGRDIKDLDDLLKSNTRLSPAEKTVIARSLVDGVLYFHTKSIALLDIKTPNILTGFLSQSEEKGNVRTAWMCDLGLFKKTSGALSQDDQTVLNADDSDSMASSLDDLQPLNKKEFEGQGTPPYCPIEHVTHIIEDTTDTTETTTVKAYSDSDHTLEEFAFKRDAWSLSMVLWELFSGKDILQWIKDDSAFDFIREDPLWNLVKEISLTNQLRFREVVSQKIKECAETTEFLSNERPELPITVKKSSKSVTSYFKSQQKSVNQNVVVPDQSDVYLKDVMLQCSAVKAFDRKTLQEVYDASSLKASRTGAATTIQAHFRERRAQKNLSQNGAPKEAVSEPGGAVQSGYQEPSVGSEVFFKNVSAERTTAHVKKGFITGCVAGVVLSAVGVIGALGLQSAQIITMNQIAVAGLKIGIGTLNFFGASIGSVSTLSTVGTVATFAGGIGLSIISVGVALLLFRALCELPSLFRGSSQEEPIVVQASKDNSSASSSLRGEANSAVSPIKNGVEGGFTLQETTSRGSQVASSVRAKEGVASPKNRSDHVSSPPRTLGG
jgi:serine/threonine protein kinase